jgi:hypothetical protein
LLAKPTPLNINFGSDRFAMFNKQAGHPASVGIRLNSILPWRSSSLARFAFTGRLK